MLHFNCCHVGNLELQGEMTELGQPVLRSTTRCSEPLAKFHVLSKTAPHGSQELPQTQKVIVQRPEHLIYALSNDMVAPDISSSGLQHHWRLKNFCNLRGLLGGKLTHWKIVNNCVSISCSVSCVSAPPNNSYYTGFP